VSNFSVYCDESCHLPRDRIPIMAFGCTWCPNSEVRRLSDDLAALKAAYSARGELKWTKTSPARLDFYKSILNWFMAEESIHFRAFVVLHKERLDHDAFNQGSHDTFYYKMYFSLLSKILSPDSCYTIYLDIKDTRSRLRIRKLRDVLCHDKYDFTHSMIERVQNIRSEESALIQLTDFLLGIVAYRNRGLEDSYAKSELVRSVEKSINRSLLVSSPLAETKFNLFRFSPRKLES
jgi:hypothetical protein